MLYIKLQKSLPVESPWVTVPPLRLGKVPSGLGTANLCVTIEDDDGPVLRADLYDLYADQSLFVKQEAMIWGDRGFVGFGNSVYVIDPKAQSGSAIHLGSYFADFYATTEYLLVVSGCGAAFFASRRCVVEDVRPCAGWCNREARRRRLRNRRGRMGPAKRLETIRVATGLRRAGCRLMQSRCFDNNPLG